MPPELKQFEDALRKSGLNDKNDIDQYVDQLAFALFRPGTKEAGEQISTLGIAQGQFPTQEILANFRKKAVKPKLVRTNRIYPMGKTGMVLCFVDPSTLVFGGMDAVKAALEARDGGIPNLLDNAPMMDAMRSIEAEPLWSILDQKGTQTMMRQILGQAGPLSEFETVQKRLNTSWYSMNFQHGVKFDMSVVTGDNFSAATVSSLLNAAVLYQKMSGTDSDKQALEGTVIRSNSGRLDVHFSSSDAEFNALLKSPMFQSMVR